jgi:hypothetical protein
LIVAYTFTQYACNAYIARARQLNKESVLLKNCGMAGASQACRMLAQDIVQNAKLRRAEARAAGKWENQHA